MLRARSHAVQCARRAAASPYHGGGGRGREASALAKPLADSNCQLPTTQSRFQGNHVDQQLQRVQQTLQARAKDVDASGANNGTCSRQDRGGEGGSLQQVSLVRQRTPGATLTTRLRGMFTHKGGGPWRLAVHVLEKGRKEGIKDVKAYNAVLKMIAVDEWMRDDKLKQMEGLFRQMKLDGLEPEVHTYNSLIHAFGQAGKEEGAVRLYGEMVKGGVLPDRRTLSSMIVAHSWGSVSCMRRVAVEMKAKGWLATRRAHSAMIGALHRVEDWKGVLDVAKAMVESKQTLTEAGFAVAIKGARRLGQADLGRRFLADYGKAKFRPKEALYASVMEAFRSAGRHEDCLACWRELVVLDGLGDVNVSERTYNLALRSAVRAERWEEMEGIFDMMQARGVEPNEETYRSLVGAPSGKTPGGGAPVDRTADAVHGRAWRPSEAQQQQLRATAADRSRSNTSDRVWLRARALVEDARRKPIALPGADVKIMTSRHVVEKSIDSFAAHPTNGLALAGELRPEGFELNEACRVVGVSDAPPSTAGDRIETAKYLAEVKGWRLPTSAEGGEAVLAAESSDVVAIAGRVGGGGGGGGEGGDGGNVGAGAVKAEGNDDERDASLRPEHSSLGMGCPESVRFGVPDPPACENPWFHEAWSAKKLRKRDELLG